jgi:Peptidase S24-like
MDSRIETQQGPGSLSSSPLDPARARLVSLAAERGVSLSALSGLLGRNAAYLQQFVRKGSPRKLEENDRRTLAEFFGVDEAELGAPPRETVLTVGSAGGAGQGARTADWADIPRLPLGASAGPGTLAKDAAPTDRLRFSGRWLRQQGLEPAMLSVIEVEGDSMEPTLRDGDEILVDCSQRSLRSGLHVIRLDDMLLVKRLEPGSAGTVLIISDNPAYPRMERPRADVAVLGRVVWKGGRI